MFFPQLKKNQFHEPWRHDQSALYFETPLTQAFWVGGEKSWKLFFPKKVCLTFEFFLYND